MLVYLRVSNFAVVESVEIEFVPGFNVFTGETGAGKSILLDAIGFLVRKKIPEGSIREGADKLIVEAMFEKGDEEIILRREARSTRSVCFINGSLVNFMQLKETAGELLNLYSQHEHLYLMNSANHRKMIDEFAGTDTELDELKNLSAKFRKISSELEDIDEKRMQANERLDILNYRISEIDELGMKESDEDDLKRRFGIISSAESILSRVNSLLDSSYLDENSVYNRLAEGLGDLEYLMEHYPELAGYYEQLNSVYGVLPDLSASLTAISGGVEFDEDELNRTEETLHKLERLKKKYNCESLAELLEQQKALMKERGELENIEHTTEEKKAELDAILAEYRDINIKLRNKRYSAAEKLSTEVESELESLEMKNSSFQVRVMETEPSAGSMSESGSDEIEFYFSSNPGQKPARLKETASGGELSRLMLVLKSLSGNESGEVYIFDEIDTGIGGKTADFVGSKLKRIAADNQVICISHLPQIAAYAETHFLIKKEVRENRTFSTTEELSPSERVNELARMMAGSTINADVLNAAESLLERGK